MKIALSILLLAASNLCSAAEPTLSKQYDACMDKSEGVTPDMLACIATETKRQDAQLNASYKAAIDATPKARQAKLRDAQRNWIKYRDTSCDYFNDPDAGSAASVDTASCVLTTTAERSKSLADIAKMMAAR